MGAIKSCTRSLRLAALDVQKRVTTCRRLAPWYAGRERQFPLAFAHLVTASRVPLPMSVFVGDGIFFTWNGTVIP